MDKGGEKRVVCVDCVRTRGVHRCRRRGGHIGSDAKERDRVEKRKRDESRSVRGGGKRNRSKKTPFDESERGGRREVIGWGNIDFVS